jgi:hypothetical protein
MGHAEEEGIFSYSDRSLRAQSQWLAQKLQRNKEYSPSSQMYSNTDRLPILTHVWRHGQYALRAHVSSPCSPLLNPEGGCSKHWNFGSTDNPHRFQYYQAVSSRTLSSVVAAVPLNIPVFLEGHSEHLKVCWCPLVRHNERAFWETRTPTGTAIRRKRQ